jgi:NADPH:quinone reductase
MEELGNGRQVAVRIHRTGGEEVLQLDEVPIPSAGPRDAILRLRASGVNFIDVYHRVGLYNVSLPFTLGMEGAGEVVEIGSEVRDLEVGDRVAYQGVAGSYAQYAKVPAERLVRVPPEVDLELAAAVMLQGMTAHYLTHSAYAVTENTTCLVHAAAGGVGLLLCQIASRRGAHVIGTVSTSKKAEVARSAGARDIVLYAEQDFEVEVKRITRGKGVDVVYDSVGQSTFDRSLKCLKPRGFMVLFGQSSGPVPPFDPQILNQRGALFLTRPSLGPYVQEREELLWRSTDLFRWIVEGKLRVHIDRKYALPDAGRAHRDLESRSTTGKLLLIP